MPSVWKKLKNPITEKQYFGSSLDISLSLMLFLQIRNKYTDTCPFGKDGPALHYVLLRFLKKPD